MEHMEGRIIDRIVAGMETLRFGGWLSSRDSFCSSLVWLRKGLETLEFKLRQGDDFPLTVTLQGGTGTGKSSLFNALIGAPVSRTGVERPQTRGSIFFLPERASSLLEEERPFASFPRQRLPQDSLSTPVEGEPGGITLVEHRRAEWSRIMLVDSPDLDSVEQANRTLAEEIIMLSDLVVFVTSQEKYADRTPFGFIRDAGGDRKPFLLVINKLDSAEGLDDLKAKLREFALFPESEVIGLPRLSRGAPVVLSEESIKGLRDLLFNLDIRRVLEESRRALRAFCRRVLEGAAEELLREAMLHRRVRETTGTLIDGAQSRLEEKLSSRMDEHTEREIRKHIRTLLARYDFLQKPRSLARSIIKLPIRLLGLGRRNGETAVGGEGRFSPVRPQQEALIEAHAWFQQSLVRFMGQEEALSLLYARMAQEEIFFSAEELKQRYDAAQKEIEAWLKEKFKELRKGLSRPKEVGLYSASIMAGIFIIAVESVTFGGFTFFEIMLDTAIAPFIPRGVLELFVYDQLKDIARELDRLHRRALFSILDEQRSRLEGFLDEHMAGSGDMATMQEALQWAKQKA